MAEWRKQTDNERRALATRLWQARKAAGLDQQEVADRLGIGSRSIISELETGQRRLDVVELMALAKLYGRPPDWFLQAAPDEPAPPRWPFNRQPGPEWPPHGGPLPR